MERVVFAASDYSLASRRQGYRPTMGDVKKIYRASQQIIDADIEIRDEGGISVQTLRAAARRHKQKNPGLKVIAIDYLQLMRSDSKQAASSREREISEISSSLKAMAKELDVVVFCLSQLNRNCETRPDKRPRMADLRESGAIEQDADVIGFLFRPAVYEADEGLKQEMAPISEFIVGKNRNGEVGTAMMRFEGPKMTFVDASDDDVTNWQKN